MFSILNECSEYKPNNIEYRIITSKWLGVFKLKQSETLSEIIYNAPNHQFSPLAKEVVLLKYNLWFIFILWLENFLLRVHTQEEENQLSVKEIEEIKQKVKTKAVQIKNQYTNIINRYIKINKWDKKYFDLWLEYHKDVEKFLFEFIITKYFSNSTNYFVALVSKLINILNLTLFEVYELDNALIVKDKFPVVYVDDMLLEIDSTLNILKRRIKLLEENGVKFSRDKIIIKSYIKNDVLITTDFYKWAEDNFSKIIVE